MDRANHHLEATGSDLEEGQLKDGGDDPGDFWTGTIWERNAELETDIVLRPSPNNMTS